MRSSPPHALEALVLRLTSGDLPDGVPFLAARDDRLTVLVVDPAQFPWSAGTLRAVSEALVRLDGPPSGCRLRLVG